MDLINEQDRLFSKHSTVVLCLCDNLFHIFFACHSRIDLHKLRAGRIRDHPRKSRFARSGRSVKNDGGKLVRLNRTVQKLVLSDNVLLPDYLIQRPGPQPCRQRRFLFLIGLSHIIEKIHVPLLYRY